MNFVKNTIAAPKYIVHTVKSQAVDWSTEVCFASFLSGGFIAAIVVNPERKLAKYASVHCGRSFN